MFTRKNLLKKILVTGMTIAGLCSQAIAGGDFRDIPNTRERSHTRACNLYGNLALTTDYVSRGYSQTQEDPAFQVGMDVVCGVFYAGFWGTNIDYNTSADFEVDLYFGMEREYRGTTYGLAFIYYAHDGNTGIDSYEIRSEFTREIGNGIKLGLISYWNFDDSIYTYEAIAKHKLQKIGPFTPELSGMLGTVTGDGQANDYVFWHAGVELGFADHFKLDLRYHDTDVNNDTLADERFVATLSAEY
ncbi:MAG: TorF family putative porin [Methyloligellaceae bacterium]